MFLSGNSCLLNLYKKKDVYDLYISYRQNYASTVTNYQHQLEEKKVAKLLVGFREVTDNVSKEYGSRIKKAAKFYKRDPRLVVSVVAIESKGDSRVISPKGAKGLGQINDITSSHLNLKNPFNPYENLLATSKYLKELQDRFGDRNTALAAYNLGPGEVDKRIKEGNFKPENLLYVKKVNYIYRNFAKV